VEGGKMEITPEEWLYRFSVEHLSEYGRVPTVTEMREAVRADAMYIDSPFCHMSQVERLAQMCAVLKNFGIMELEREEIAVKTRDGEANLNNRRYNDANF
jgi:hypothetical protein